MQLYLGGIHIHNYDAIIHISEKVPCAQLLVKWVIEGTVSTIPAGWILEPEALPPNDRLPVKGKCYWKRKRNSLETLVLGKYLLILYTESRF